VFFIEYEWFLRKMNFKVPGPNGIYSVQPLPGEIQTVLLCSQYGDFGG